MLELYTPKMDDLWFRAEMMQNALTMAYNKGYEGYPGYHSDTGCIEFPKEEWETWYRWMMNHEPERFYAYIQRKADRKWIGEVCYHYTPESDWWDMGIVIHAPYRAMGYGVPALKLLLQHAFEESSVTKIHNYFEDSRIQACKIHRAVGFEKQREENGKVHFLITREHWIQNSL